MINRGICIDCKEYDSKGEKNMAYYDPYGMNPYGFVDPYGYMYGRMPAALNPMTEYGYVRLIHASPDAPGVDVYVDGERIASNVLYAQPVNYIAVPVGAREFEAYVTGTTQNPVLRGEVNVMKGMYFTLAAIGNLQNLRPLLVVDNMKPTMPQQVQVRAIHVSYDAPAVDVIASEETVLFENIRYGDITQYTAVSPATYTFRVRLTGNSEAVVLTVPNQSLRANRNYSLYIIGEAAQQTLMMLVLPDGRVMN